jgi:ADP-ribosyl-[dinitrogen reductase] hydrolase
MKPEKISTHYPSEVSQKDRIKGSILGALIGDALGVGCQWYYEPGALAKEFGPWIDNYVDPKTDSISAWARVHAHRHAKGIRGGDESQTGQFIGMLLESVATNRGYDRQDFSSRIDTFFASLDGEASDPYAGVWTDEVVRIVRKARQDGVAWDDPNFSSPSDGADGAMRGVVLAAAYRDPVTLANLAYSDISLFFQENYLIGHQVTYMLFVQAVINNVPLGELAAYVTKLGDDHAIMQHIQNYDSIDSPKHGAVALDPDFRTVPAWKFCRVFGLDCQATHLLPSAYYLSYRYPDDFEMAVLSAINSGGNNMARATLTGGIVGAMVGIGGIPERLISGLSKAEEYLAFAETIAEFATGESGYQQADYNPTSDGLPHSADAYKKE